MLWEREAASLDFFIGGLDFGSFKGRFTDELGVNDDTDRPDVDLVRVPLPFQNLRSDVVGSSADSFLFLFIVLQPRGQSEVPQFDLHVFVEEEVSQFEISMDDFVLVKIDERSNDLMQVVHHLHLSKSLPALNQLV